MSHFHTQTKQHKVGRPVQVWSERQTFQNVKAFMAMKNLGAPKFCAGAPKKNNANNALF